MAKSGQKFDLGKGTKREFDLEKQTTRRFDLEKEDGVTGTEIVQSNSHDQDVPKVSSPSSKKTKIVIYAILALIAVVVLFLCYKGCDNSPATETSDDQTVTTQVEDNKGSIVDDENEAEASPTNKNDDNADEDVTSESESEESEKEETVAENPATEPQTITNSDNSVQQSNASPVSITGTLEEKAKAVIRGNYGNGSERKQKLGEEYTEIQGKVNEMYRSGLVK